jgi:hypothetical protein
MRKNGVRVFVLWLCLCLPALALAANKAGIVIQNSTGEIITRCVEFEEESLPVDELLLRSGFALALKQYDFGKMLCFLHDEGAQDCTFHPLGWFWNFFQHDGQDWIISDVGISDAVATDGSLVGFAFGEWGVAIPPPLQYSDVCETLSTAALVIDHSDGTRIIKKVEFYGETITGVQLLEKSGFNIILYDAGFGMAVCAIDNEGQNADNCFGDPKGRYWGINLLIGNSWEASMVGASDLIVYHQDVHGYLFGTWGTVQPPIQKNELFPAHSRIQIWQQY